MAVDLRSVDALFDQVRWKSQVILAVPAWVWTVLHYVLLIGFFVYTFIGTKPLGVDDPSARVDGSFLDRFAVLFLVAIAGLLIISHWRAAVEACRHNAMLLTVVFICIFSLFWSEYPDLTLRRSLLLLFLTIIALGISITTPSLRSLHTALMIFLFATMILNGVLTVLFPGFAITDIGVRGIYTQKNVAGFVAMLAILVTLTWTLGARTSAGVLVGLIALAPATLFLLASRSKTSLGLTILAVAIIFLIKIARQIGPGLVLMTLVLALFGASFGILWLTFVDFDVILVIDRTIGDATFSGRDELWRFAMRSIGDAPWLGHGYGAFWDVGAFNDPTNRLEPGTWLGDVEPGIINQAHNGYLELALHIGVPATILAVLAVARATALSGYKMVSHARSQDWTVYLLFLVVQMMFLLHNFLEASLFIRGSAFSNLSILLMFLVVVTPAGMSVQRLSRA
jgi:exopolysaccharide production protein ExoQ